MSALISTPGCAQIMTGLLRKKPIYVCKLNTKSRSTVVQLGLGTVALITRDVALIASEQPIMGLPKDALEAMPNQGEVLIKAKVHREYCWDNWILRSNDVDERVSHLVDSGLGLVVMRIEKPPNLAKIYKRPMRDGLIRATDILNMQYEVSISPTLISIIEIGELGKGKPFWAYANGGCIAGNYINNALTPLGFRVV
jgi:hypothetical protein